jgi:predicted transcriptional regulator
MDVALMERVREAAEADDRKLSAWVRKAILEKLEREGR